MITLTLKQSPSVPLEAENISPDVFANLAPDAIRATHVYLGKRQCRLDEFFEVEGPTPPGPPFSRGGNESGPPLQRGGTGGSLTDDITIHGDARKVKWIGHGMTRGRITINGNAGMHLGAHMKGGTIEVVGNAGDWVGAEMTGGLIRVSGNAGGQIGAAYRGSLAGMKGGAILIGGSAGLEVGMRMKRGLIVIGGVARDFAGLQMKGGTLVLLSGAEIRAGAWMFRGTIVSLRPLPLLPTFSYACTYQPDFLRIYANHLKTLGVSLPLTGGAYQRYTGDSSVPGMGELLVWQPEGR